MEYNTIAGNISTDAIEYATAFTPPIVVKTKHKGINIIAAPPIDHNAFRKCPTPLQYALKIFVQRKIILYMATDRLSEYDIIIVSPIHNLYTKGERITINSRQTELIIQNFIILSIFTFIHLPSCFAYASVIADHNGLIRIVNTIAITLKYLLAIE